ncbi:MAG: hypothetical protein P4L46_14615 [Fimbriimonas sp.]|nr:hypothetical protein [Fimbriimonas sp.]
MSKRCLLVFVAIAATLIGGCAHSDDTAGSQAGSGQAPTAKNGSANAAGAPTPSRIPGAVDVKEPGSKVK